MTPRCQSRCSRSAPSCIAKKPRSRPAVQSPISPKCAPSRGRSRRWAAAMRVSVARRDAASTSSQRALQCEDVRAVAQDLAVGDRRQSAVLGEAAEHGRRAERRMRGERHLGKSRRQRLHRPALQGASDRRGTQRPIALVVAEHVRRPALRGSPGGHVQQHGAQIGGLQRGEAREHALVDAEGTRHTLQMPLSIHVVIVATARVSRNPGRLRSQVRAATDAARRRRRHTMPKYLLLKHYRGGPDPYRPVPADGPVGARGRRRAHDVPPRGEQAARGARRVRRRPGAHAGADVGALRRPGRGAR